MTTMYANPLTGSFRLKDVVWAALEKIGGKQKDREAIEPDSTHDVCLTLSGTVNGEPFEQQLSSILQVGSDLRKATSTTPELPTLVAVILSKLNRVTREKLLNEIPDEFRENNQRLPNCNEDFVDQATRMLQRLRAEKQIQVKGPLRCEVKL